MLIRRAHLETERVRMEKACFVRLVDVEAWERLAWGLRYKTTRFIAGPSSGCESRFKKRTFQNKWTPDLEWFMNMNFRRRHSYVLKGPMLSSWINMASADLRPLTLLHLDFEYTPVMGLDASEWRRCGIYQFMEDHVTYSRKKECRG